MRRFMAQGSDQKKHTLRAVLGAVCLVPLVAIGLCLWRSGLLSDIHSVYELRTLIDCAGPLAWLVFFILQMLTVIIAPIPSNVTMAAGAMALGFVRALLIGVAAIICGSLIIFLVARRLGRRAVRRLVDRGVLDKYLPLIEEKQDMFLFLTLLFPFFPDDTLCILAGLTSMPTARFFLIMAVARPWGLVVAALVGSGVIRLPLWGWGALFTAMCALFFFAMKYSAPIEEALLRAVRRLTRRHKKR